MSCLLCCVVLLLALSGSQAFADLNGANVTVNYLFPDINSIFEVLGTGTVTGSGFTVNSFGQHDFTTFPTDLTLTNVFGGDVTFTAASFNGYQVVVNSGGSPITGVTIAFNDIAGFDASRISFDSTDVWINLQSLETTPGLDPPAGSSIWHQYPRARRPGSAGVRLARRDRHRAAKAAPLGDRIAMQGSIRPNRR